MTGAEGEDTSEQPRSMSGPLRPGAPLSNDLATQIIDLDRQRIVMEERRTEVALLAVQANQQADERRHVSRMLSLELRGSATRRNAKRTASSCGSRQSPSSSSAWWAQAC